ncbi:MAG: AI-2E family transporter [Deltaproteobacteria bacterium]|nr:MAG: AI-2E family transporter [Deltaproteobacteria bacterium]
MKSPNSINLPGLEDKTFLFLVVVASLAFAWILWPFFGAVLWGTILAILFVPLYRRLMRIMAQRRTLAAFATVMIVLLIVILPLVLIGALLLQEALGVYAKFQSGELDLGRFFQQVLGALPGWVSDLLNRFGLSNLSSMQDKTRSTSWSIWVSSYTCYSFFCATATTLPGVSGLPVPLHVDQQRELFNMFTTVIRATVKGNVVMAIVQGALGGLIFWFLGVHAAVLWAVVMAFLSLLPAVGSALVWVPVAIYFLVTGATWQGIVLIAFGVLVIGMVDNVLRPILVGKDTKMPDYVVLVSTLGGMAIFGLNGFVIGPVIAAMFMSVWEIFAASRVRNDNPAGPAGD